jgi:ectoine hydroxylase-related dioxygenase (phytanoyl-CoA dioxygenase family)
MGRLRLSDAELERGALRVHTLEEAKRTFHEEGWALFENAYERSFIEELRNTFFARYGGHGEEDLQRIGSRVGHDRFMFAIDLSPPFLDERVYANPFAFALIRSLLGDECVLDSFSAVVAYPGAEDQHLHLDHSLLFDDADTSMKLPPYAATLVVPLVDIGERSGSTRLFEKTERPEPSLWSKWRGGTIVEAEAGACWLMDYRLAHGGTKNPSQVPRPILYLVYARKWFTDAENFVSRARFSISDESRASVPEAYRGLFRRA